MSENWFCMIYIYRVCRKESGKAYNKNIDSGHTSLSGTINLCLLSKIVFGNTHEKHRKVRKHFEIINLNISEKYSQYFLAPCSNIKQGFEEDLSQRPKEKDVPLWG